MTLRIPESMDPAVWVSAIQDPHLGVVDLFLLMRAMRRVARSAVNTTASIHHAWHTLKDELIGRIAVRRNTVFDRQAAELWCQPRHRRATMRQIDNLRTTSPDKQAYARELIRLVRCNDAVPRKLDPVQYVRCGAIDKPDCAAPFLGVRLAKKFAKGAPPMTDDRVRLAKKTGWDYGYEQPNDGAGFLILKEAYRKFGPGMTAWEKQNFMLGHTEGRRARAVGAGNVKNPYRV